MVDVEHSNAADPGPAKHGGRRAAVRCNTNTRAASGSRGGWPQDVDVVTSQRAMGEGSDMLLALARVSVITTCRRQGV